MPENINEANYYNAILDTVAETMLDGVIIGVQYVSYVIQWFNTTVENEETKSNQERIQEQEPIQEQERIQGQEPIQESIQAPIPEDDAALSEAKREEERQRQATIFELEIYEQQLKEQNQSLHKMQMKKTALNQELKDCDVLMQDHEEKLIVSRERVSAKESDKARLTAQSDELKAGINTLNDQIKEQKNLIVSSDVDLNVHNQKMARASSFYGIIRDWFRRGVNYLFGLNFSLYQDEAKQSQDRVNALEVLKTALRDNETKKIESESEIERIGKELVAIELVLATDQADLQRLETEGGELKQKQVALTTDINKLNLSIKEKEERINETIVSIEKLKVSLLPKESLKDHLSKGLKTIRSQVGYEDILGDENSNNVEDEGVDFRTKEVPTPHSNNKRQKQKVEPIPEEQRSKEEKTIPKPRSIPIFELMNKRSNKTDSNVKVDDDSDDDWDHDDAWKNNEKKDPINKEDNELVSPQVPSPTSVVMSDLSNEAIPKTPDNRKKKNAASAANRPLKDEKLREINENREAIKQQMDDLRAKKLALDISKDGCLFINLSQEQALTEEHKKNILSKLDSRLAVVSMNGMLYLISQGFKQLKINALSSQDKEREDALVEMKQYIDREVEPNQLKSITAKEDQKELARAVYCITGVKHEMSTKAALPEAGSEGMEAGQKALLSSDDSRKLKGLLLTCSSRQLIKTDIKSIDFPSKDEEDEIREARKERSAKKSVAQRVAELWDEIRERTGERFIADLAKQLVELGYVDPGPVIGNRSTPVQQSPVEDLQKRPAPTFLASIREQKKQKTANDLELKENNSNPNSP